MLVNWNFCLSVFERAIIMLSGWWYCIDVEVRSTSVCTSYGTLVHRVERRHEMAGRNDTPER